MAANYNETAKTLKSKAENRTQWIQQQPSQQRNQSGRHHQRYIRHQMNRARMCFVVARKTMKSVKHIAEPKCDADGNYETIQCESSGKWCWCVNENGKRVGSTKLPKELNCSGTDKGRNQSFKKIFFRKELLHLSRDCGRILAVRVFRRGNSNKAKTQNKINPQYTLVQNSSPSCPLWWEGSALITALTLPLRLPNCVIFFTQYYYMYLFLQEEKNFALLCLALDQARDRMYQAHAETTVTALTLKYVARLAQGSEAVWLRFQRCQKVG